MAKSGNIKNVGSTETGSEKDFAGSGIEGQKDPGADQAGSKEAQAEADRLAAEEAQAEADRLAAEEAPAVEPVEEDAPITGEHVLKTMRAKGIKI